MIAGVRCNYRFTKRYGLFGSSLPFGGSYIHTDAQVACADIYTGLAVTSSFRFNERKVKRQAVVDTTVNPLIAGLYRDVLRMMPLFEMRSMIDMLFLYAHPGLPDLTEGTQHIAAAASPNLCLDVQWGSPEAGTPVWLWDCNGGAAQWWVYDRQSGTIHNPAYSRCLDVQWGNPAPGAPVWLWDCNGGDAQKWTYDPETGVLQSALGTALDLDWGVLQAWAPAQMWSRHDGPSQRWFSTTHAIGSGILARWASLNGAIGLLGLSVTDELPTADGIGRVTHFQGGSIYWHPNIGAYEVHGAIRQRWWDLGAELSLLGYPITDELPTEDGTGQVSAFTGGWIYWTSYQGAYEVYR
jgi:hypothetical protein